MHSKSGMAKRWPDSRWWRWIQAAAGLAVIGFVARHLIRNWETVRAESISWEFKPHWILLSLVLVLATYALLAEAWRRMLAGWGPRLGFREAARIWVMSSMGKYLPGKVWAIAGMALLAERRGISPAIATASALILQIASLGTGALVVGLTGVSVLESHRPGSRWAVSFLLVASVVALAMVMRPGAATRVLRRFTGAKEQRITPPAGPLGFGGQRERRGHCVQHRQCDRGAHASQDRTSRNLPAFGHGSLLPLRF